MARVFPSRPLLRRLVLSELSPEQFVYGSLDKLLHARLLFASLCAEDRSAGFLSSEFESLAVFLHPGRRLHPRLLQLLLHAGIFSLLVSLLKSGPSYYLDCSGSGVLELVSRLFSKLAILSTRRAWRPPSNSVCSQMRTMRSINSSPKRSADRH